MGAVVPGWLGRLFEDLFGVELSDDRKSRFARRVIRAFSALVFTCEKFNPDEDYAAKWFSEYAEGDIDAAYVALVLAERFLGKRLDGIRRFLAKQIAKEHGVDVTAAATSGNGSSGEARPVAYVL